LPDFSYAGYGRGERAIPEFPRGVSVRDFGARGDGKTDDTRAFQRALEEVESGAIEVPPGRYMITDFLEIKRSRTLLRGADPKNTVLVFPKPLNDITVSGFCSGNVVMNGRGVDLSLDHHRKAPYANLFTDLDAGAGNRLWKCGGGAALGKNCGAWGTFWRIRSANPLAYPPERFGPATLNLVALETNQRPVVDPNGKWFETMDPDIIHPPNMYLAQKEKRLGH
jgi:hypothetical protein